VEASENRVIAACGLVCSDCDIFKVPTDAMAAENVVKWFKTEGWIKQSEGVSVIIEKGMYCKTCLGDRSLHWNPECWILLCCVDQHGLENCSQCADFLCKKLMERAESNSRYTAALNRLKVMAESSLK
jgi:hypothetical protein